MVLYRRNQFSGGTFFFTLTLRDRRARTWVEHVDLLCAAYARTLAERPFRTDAIVVLPDQLHAIWTLPEGDADYSGRWRAIKAAFVRGPGGIRCGCRAQRQRRGFAMATTIPGTHRAQRR